MTDFVHFEMTISQNVRNEMHNDLNVIKLTTRPQDLLNYGIF